MKIYTSPGHRNIMCETIQEAAWEFARRYSDHLLGCGRGDVKNLEYIGDGQWTARCQARRGEWLPVKFTVSEWIDPKKRKTMRRVGR